MDIKYGNYEGGRQRFLINNLLLVEKQTTPLVFLNDLRQYLKTKNKKLESFLIYLINMVYI